MGPFRADLSPRVVEVQGNRLVLEADAKIFGCAFRNISSLTNGACIYCNGAYNINMDFVSVNICEVQVETGSADGGACCMTNNLGTKITNCCFSKCQIPGTGQSMLLSPQATSISIVDTITVIQCPANSAAGTVTALFTANTDVTRVNASHNRMGGFISGLRIGSSVSKANATASQCIFTHGSASSSFGCRCSSPNLLIKSIFALNEVKYLARIAENHLIISHCLLRGFAGMTAIPDPEEAGTFSLINVVADESVPSLSMAIDSTNVIITKTADFDIAGLLPLDECLKSFKFSPMIKPLPFRIRILLLSSMLE